MGDVQQLNRLKKKKMKLKITPKTSCEKYENTLLGIVIFGVCDVFPTRKKKDKSSHWTFIKLHLLLNPSNVAHRSLLLRH